MFHFVTAAPIGVAVLYNVRVRKNPDPHVAPRTMGILADSLQRLTEDIKRQDEERTARIFETIERLKGLCDDALIDDPLESELISD